MPAAPPVVAIRQAHSADEAAILDIGLRTADRGHDATALYGDPRLPGLVWALPYVRLCPDHAFVLTCDGIVMGYCVATPDTRAFEDRLAVAWWPALKQELAGFAPGSVEDDKVLRYIGDPERTPESVTEAYPAHLHINVLPALQKGGHGSALLRHQLQALALSGVIGVHLGIDPRNAGVAAFYARFGFVERLRTPSIIMGRTLTPWGRPPEPDCLMPSSSETWTVIDARGARTAR
ncbi:GNAT family N-acetyltransferase [Rhizobium sp. Leaf384]|uniref:GNAT family N-acetyltransferase n=1 Tax=Rhizobium sp. Leaf384 TaxID=1736358 RepID=UPI0019109812|nr:GNAT family N-acetyltransferase [Rhizobium sp. Leaf384]